MNLEQIKNILNASVPSIDDAIINVSDMVIIKEGVTLINTESGFIGVMRKGGMIPKNEISPMVEMFVSVTGEKNNENISQFFDSKQFGGVVASMLVNGNSITSIEEEVLSLYEKFDAINDPNILDRIKIPKELEQESQQDFVVTAAKALQRGDDKFTFAGKTFPVTLKKKVADIINKGTN